MQCKYGRVSARKLLFKNKFRINLLLNDEFKFQKIKVKTHKYPSQQRIFKFVLPMAFLYSYVVFSHHPCVMITVLLRILSDKSIIFNISTVIYAK